MSTIEIRAVDPLGQDALMLLRQAALEARALYPELFGADVPWPTNVPLMPRGVYRRATSRFFNAKDAKTQRTQRKTF